MEQLSFLNSPDKNESKPTTHWILYVDGAARNNPGPAGAGIYVLKNGEPYLKRGYYLGVMTNNEAEYNALLLGMFLLSPLWQEADELHIYADSQLMIRQLQGAYKVAKPTLKKLHGCAVKFLKLKKYQLMHIMRENNTIADLLANQGIDKRIPLPDGFNLFCTDSELS
jgi:ribonuclease HI